MDLDYWQSLQPFQQRVVEERAARLGEAERLSAFIAKPPFMRLPIQERDLLFVQLRILRELVFVLDQRIKLFKPAALQVADCV